MALSQRIRHSFATAGDERRDQLRDAVMMPSLLPTDGGAQRKVPP
jgi:hypothetical protein